MRPLIEKIIDSIQSVFVPHRSIHNNILLLYEVINKFNTMKGKKSWFALELNIKKIMIEWNESSWLKVSKN